MKEVNTLKTEGKRYMLYYGGKKVIDITLEAGCELTLEDAFEIINTAFVKYMKAAPRKHIEKVSFEEI